MSEVLVCGILCNNDIALAELLSRYSVPVKVIRHISHQAIDSSQLPGALRFFFYNNIKYVSCSWEFYINCYKAPLIISINGYFPSMLNRKMRFLSYFFRFPKVINLTCGSDITELVISNTIEGKRYKQHLKKSFFNYVSPYPNAIKNLLTIKLQNFMLYRFNFFLLGKRILNVEHNDTCVTFFHPSHLDWGVTDNTANRNSTKGNDRFLKAFLRALEKGVKAKCIILDRGPDREEAKKIINNSSFSKSFEWLNQLTPAELKQQMLKSDVIVDQFDVGGLGGIACEAMAQAKPVMMYIDKNCWPLVYDEEPPVINCYTEEEIYNAILEWADRKKLQELGERAEKWVRKYHDVHTADFSEFILRVCLAAGLEWPRKDLAKID